MRAATHEIFSQIGAKLKDRGFSKKREQVYMKPIGQTVQGWMGLNRGSRSGATEINLVVGVRESRVEDEVGRLLEEAVDEVSPPTIAANVGYTKENGRYFAVIFSEENRIEDSLAELTKALDDWGIAFIESNSDLERMIVTMKTAKFLMDEQTAYRLPTALSLGGRKAEAKAFVEERLLEIGGRSDPAAERYRKFAGRLLSELA